MNRRLEAKVHRKALCSGLFRSQGVELLLEPIGCRSNHWLVSLRFTDDDPLLAQAERLQVIECAHAIGLLLRPIWTPLHQLPMYEACPAGSLAVAENEAPRLLNLPSSPQLLKGWAA